MATIVIEIPLEYENEIKSWNVDFKALFEVFLKQEFEKIKRFEDLLKNSKNVAELKKLADDMNEEVLWVLADRILSKSKLTEEQANELAEELKERVAKRLRLL
jgi:hypothetical protein